MKKPEKKTWMRIVILIFALIMVLGAVIAPFIR